MLDDGLDDADNLQGYRRHHLGDVAAANRQETNFFMMGCRVKEKVDLYILQFYTHYSIF